MRQSIVLIGGLLATALPAMAASPAAPAGNEFQINTYTFGSQGFPSIAADAAGDFVAVWVSYSRTAISTASSGSASITRARPPARSSR